MKTSTGRRTTPGTSHPPRRRRLGRTAERRLFAYLLMAPAAILVLALIAYPLAIEFNLSLRDVRGFQILGALDQPLDLSNYMDMLGSRYFWNAVLNSGIYVLTATALSLGLGLVTALILNQKLPARPLLRTLIISPWPIAGVSVALVFSWMFDGSFGIVNKMLLSLGLIDQPVQWLTSSQLAWVPIIVATAWKSYPFLTVMILAGLQSIPRELYEAASSDGAGAAQSFWSITLPGLRPTLGIGLVITSLNVFKNFEIIYLLTGGGPVRATETLAIQIYREAFDYMSMGYAAAIGVATLVLAVLMTVGYLRTSRSGLY